MRKGALLAFLVLLAPLSAMGPAAVAQSRYDRGGIEPLDRLLPEIRRSYPGQFYDAEGPMSGPGGQLFYQLKWMTPDGRIVWLDADARTGRVLGSDSMGREPQPRYEPPPSYSYPQRPSRGGSRFDNGPTYDGSGDRGRNYGGRDYGGRGGDRGGGRSYGGRHGGR